MAVTARAAFDRQLHTLQDDTLLLGSMVEKAIERSIDALVRLAHGEDVPVRSSR